MNSKFCSAEEAMGQIHSGDRVFVQGSAATTLVLLEALSKRAADLTQVEIVSISMLCLTLKDDTTDNKRTE